MKPRPVALAAMFGSLSLLVLGSGCSYEASTYVGDREVSARTSTLDGVRSGGGGESARLIVGRHAFDVTERTLSWKPDYMLELPEGWKTLELVQSGRNVLVRIDGQLFRKIAPAA